VGGLAAGALVVREPVTVLGRAGLPLTGYELLADLLADDLHRLAAARAEPLGLGHLVDDPPARELFGRPSRWAAI